MPEGPEVHTITDYLRSKLVGLYIKSTDFTEQSKLNKKFLGLELIKNSDNFPLEIMAIHCKGKQIFFELKAYDSNNIYYLNSTLGMEGRWMWTKGNHSDFWLDIAYFKPIDKFNILTYWTTLYFDDSRHFGNLSFLTPDQYINKLSEIGPDLLTDTITLQEWTNKITNPRIKNKEICEFLMEQKHFSGIGNYLKAEVLYQAKVMPDRSLSSLTSDEIKLLLEASTTIIKASYQSRGLTIKSYWDPEGNKGLFTTKVYNKSIDPFGNKVEMKMFKDKRTTHYVPTIQK